jgi:hypothetical protein
MKKFFFVLNKRDTLHVRCRAILIVQAENHASQRVFLRYLIQELDTIYVLSSI